MVNSYKDNLLLKIKQYLSQYKEEFKANGQIEYDSCQDANGDNSIIRVIQVIGSIWGIIILAVVSYVIYTEFIVPQNISISISCYIVVVFFLIITVIFSILFQASRLKKIEKIKINYASITLHITNAKCSQEQRYLLNEVKINSRKRRQMGEYTRNNKTYDVYVVYKKRKMEYLLTVENEQQFFAFVLFYKALCCEINIENLSDDELYGMYHGKLAKGE